MGLHQTRPNSSNMTTVSCDEHSDNYLHVPEMSDSNAVSQIRDENKIHSLLEQQMVSTRDKPSSTVSCQLQSDIMMNHCDNRHHRTVSSIRDPEAHHSSLEQQVASTRDKHAPCHTCQTVKCSLTIFCRNVTRTFLTRCQHSAIPMHFIPQMGPQVASAHAGHEHAEAAKKLAPCSKVFWNS